MAARHNYREASAQGYSHSTEYLVDQAAQAGSRNLLVAQLRTGQHSLAEDQFWKVVRELRAERHL